MPLTSEQIRTRLEAWATLHAEASQEFLSYKAFWVDFFDCFGVAADTAGVTFQRRALRKTTGRDGAIDVFWSAAKGGDGVLIEHKSRGHLGPRPDGTTDAEAQAFDYLDGGSIADYEQPRWVIVSDFATITLIDRSAASEARRSVTLPIEDVADRIDLFAWVIGQEQIGIAQARVQAAASVEAARLMGELYGAYTGDADTPDLEDQSNEDPRTEEASVLLTRLLFLMYGEDAGLLSLTADVDEAGVARKIFTDFILDHTKPDGSDLGALLKELFDVLNAPEDRRPRRLSPVLAEFPYVNGDVFSPYSFTNLYFDAAMRDALVRACLFDWSNISPAVFGSMFQTVKSKQARHGDGEHYTSEQNILKALGPMFLDELTERVAKARSQRDLLKIQKEMGSLRFLDPACGCGNFLIVAYREMRRLEHRIIARLIDTASRSHMNMEGFALDVESLIRVRLDSFYGIELNWWPAKIAETAMFLIDHQMNRELHQQLNLKLDRLPIKIAPTIHHGNALVRPEETAQAGDETRLWSWNELVPNEPGTYLYVFGNPPFLGRDRTTEAQKLELRQAWRREQVGHLDYVTAWHAKTLDFMAIRPGEWAYVTTNSITQGEPVQPLFAAIHDAGWEIKFAHRTFKWDSESRSDEKAAVHVVIVGFSRDTRKRRLFTYADPKADPVEVKVDHKINGYLVDADALYVTSRSKPLSPALAPVAYGSMARDDGALLVEAEDYVEVAADPIASKYLRRFIGAKQLIHDLPRWCLWMTELEPADVGRSSLLKERLRRCADVRSASKAATTRALAATPHLFAQNGQPSEPYLCIPRHFSETRPYATVDRFDPSVIAGDANFTTIDPDGFVFAIISSTMFITWQRTVGGRIKSDVRFSKDIVWNNLALPEPTSSERAIIIKAGQAVRAARALHSGRSLADHYQPLAMEPALVKAHRALDKVVDRAFGWDGRSRLDEAARQRLLFERYTELTSPTSACESPA
ncbi:DNA methyltransferase [Pimelobacter simplex]|uniref:DNA methyltransferase n=1 Tax=Nocardioides simplex TaxID=2045 RepID=UPI003AAB89AD